jgi:hypothetical protein
MDTVPARRPVPKNEQISFVATRFVLGMLFVVLSTLFSVPESLAAPCSCPKWGDDICNHCENVGSKTCTCDDLLAMANSNPTDEMCGAVRDIAAACPSLCPPPSSESSTSRSTSSSISSSYSSMSSSDRSASSASSSIIRSSASSESSVSSNSSSLSNSSFSSDTSSSSASYSSSDSSSDYSSHSSDSSSSVSDECVPAQWSWSGPECPAPEQRDGFDCRSEYDPNVDCCKTVCVPRSSSTSSSTKSDTSASSVSTSSQSSDSICDENMDLQQCCCPPEQGGAVDRTGCCPGRCEHAMIRCINSSESASSQRSDSAASSETSSSATSGGASSAGSSSSSAGEGRQIQCPEDPAKVGDFKCQGKDVVTNCTGNDNVYGETLGEVCAETPPSQCQKWPDPPGPKMAVGESRVILPCNPGSPATGVIGPVSPDDDAGTGCYTVSIISRIACIPSVCPEPTKVINFCVPGSGGHEFTKCAEACGSQCCPRGWKCSQYGTECVTDPDAVN